ncbi:MAG: 4Fe-4S binding protein [Lentimicrobiaceae bacterium]|jgi:2-oxoglutarate ferredoxin oxidoreductase subunit delta|nr:4Fe-4S binding protein [Lentimicrobiaceae bacterium]
MAKIRGEIVVDKERCKGCQVCVVNCPEGVITMSVEVNSKGYHYAQPSTDGCIGCANCAVVCPDGAITVYRKKFTE